MTTTQFNNKYKDFLEEDHYGLAISNLDFIEWLDEKFKEYIKIPNFTYSQIKVKFGMGRFYCEGLTIKQTQEVEDKITASCDNDGMIDWRETQN